MFVGNSSTQVLAFVLNVILARLLIPEDFGAVAIVASLVAILQVLGELGIPVAVVQKKDLNEHTLHNAFWLTLFSTVLVSLALVFASPGISLFFRNDALKGLIRVAALSFLFRGMYSFCNCLLLRAMSYRSIALIRLIGVFVSGFFSVILAIKGFGAYSIVWGQVVSGAVMLILGWSLIHYQPKFCLVISEIRGLFSFGLWVSVNRLLNNIAGKVDAMIIGRTIGSAELGEYFLAQRLILVLPSLLSGALDQVLLPAYSSLQGNPEKVERAYWDSLVFSLLFTLPPVCLIFLFSDELVFLLYGGKWINMAPLMRIMSIFAFAGCFGGGIFGSVLYSQGKPKVMTIVSIFRVVTLPACLLIGSLRGVSGIAWGFAIYGIIGRIFNQVVLKFSLDYSLTLFSRKIAGPLFASIIATIVSFLLLELVSGFGLSVVGGIIIRILVGSSLWIVSYYLVVSLLCRKDFRRFKEAIFSLKRG